MDSEVLFDDTDPQDSDWSVRLRYTPFDQVGPYRQMRLFFSIFSRMAGIGHQVRVGGVETVIVLN